MPTRAYFLDDIDFSKPIHHISMNSLSNDPKKFLLANEGQYDVRNVEIVSSYNWWASALSPSISKRT